VSLHFKQTAPGRPHDQSSFKEQCHPEKSKSYPKAKPPHQANTICFCAALAGHYAPPPFSGVPCGHGLIYPGQPANRKLVLSMKNEYYCVVSFRARSTFRLRMKVSAALGCSFLAKKPRKANAVKPKLHH